MKYLTAILLLFASVIFGQITIVGPMGFSVDADTTSGIIGFGLDDGRRLSFDFRAPWAGRESSHLTFLLNDTLYTTATWLSGCPALSSRTYITSVSYDSTGISFRWDINGVTVIEEIRFGIILGMPGTYANYIVINNREAPINFGLLLNIDVLINTVDNVVFEADSVMFSSGKIFTGEGIPYTIQFHEHRGGGGLIGRLLTSVSGRRASLIAVGRQSVFYSVCWDISPDAIVDRPFSDVGMVMRWDSRSLNPLEADTLGFFYGVGNIWGAPHPVLWSSPDPEFYGENCTLQPNPFEFQIKILNLHFGEAIDSITVCLNLDTLFFFDRDSSCKLVYPLSIPAESIGYASWRIAFDSTSFTRTTSCIFSGIILIDNPHFENTPFFNEITIPGFPPIPPFGRPISPHGIISCHDSVEVIFRLYSPSDYDTTSPILIVNDEIFTVADGIHIENDTLHFRLPARFITHGNTIHYNLVALRSIEGCALEDTTGDSLTIDLFPPIITSVYPPPGATISDSALIAYAVIYDGPSQVNPDSLRIIISFGASTLELTARSPFVFFYQDTLFIMLTDALPPIHTADTVTITLTNIMDSPSLCPPNRAEPFTWHFYFNRTSIKQKTTPTTFDIKTFPNPFNSTLTILLTTPEKDYYELHIYNILGKEVFFKNLKELNPGTHTLTWSPTTLPSGLYLCNLTSKKYNKRIWIAYIK